MSGGMSGGCAKWCGVVRVAEASLSTPKDWKVGRTIFCNYMSDLFHGDMAVDFIQRIFSVMRDTPQHTYQILTKRTERLEELSGKLD